MKKYVCDACGWEYDEAVGDPENGIAPGTKFEDLPDDFICPLCGVGKDLFSEAEQFFCEAGLALMLYPFFICILICCTKDDTIRIATNKKEIHYEKDPTFDYSHVIDGMLMLVRCTS